MPGERVFLRTNAEKPFSLKMKNRYFPRNRPFLRFSGRKLKLTALSCVFRAALSRVFPEPYSDAFFPPASNGTIEMPGERVFLRTNAEKPFSLKMKNRYFPLKNLS